MAIEDGILVRLQRAAGDSGPVNSITSTAFTNSTTGTVSGVEEGGELAWRFQGPDEFHSAIQSVVTDDNGPPSSLAFRGIVVQNGNAYASIVSMSRAGLNPSGTVITMAGQSGTKVAYSNQGYITTGYDPRVTAKTYVLNANLNSSGVETNKFWGSLGGTGDAPDLESVVYNGNSTSWDLATIGNSVNTYDIIVLDFVVWDRSLTDAEARLVAQDIRQQLPVSGGAVPTGTTTVTNVTPAETTASVGYSYDAADQTGFNYRLDGGAAVDVALTNPFVISGLTENTSYTVEVQAYNASGVGAWSTPATSFTTNAATIPAITTEPLRNNTGQLLNNQTGVTADVYDTSTGALVVRKTGLTSDASGIITFSDALMSALTEYRVVITLSTNAEGLDRITTS